MSLIRTSLDHINVAVGPLLAQIADPGTATDFPGQPLLVSMLSWLKWLALAGCLAAFFIGGGLWGLSYQAGNTVGASRGRQFALGGGIGAFILGLAPTAVNRLAGLA